MHGSIQCSELECYDKKHVKASSRWKDSYPTIKRLKYIAATSAMQSYPSTSSKIVHVITHTCVTHLSDSFLLRSEQLAERLENVPGQTQVQVCKTMVSVILQSITMIDIFNNWYIQSILQLFILV